MPANEHSHKEIYLFDNKDDSRLPSNATVYKWNGYQDDQNAKSVLVYVEKHSKRLRDKYLTFIYDLGKTKIDGKQLTEHLIIKDDLSFWWLSLFQEKSIYKSPISESIKLLALEEIIKIKKPHTLHLISSNSILIKIVKDLCIKLKIKFKYKKEPILIDQSSFQRRVYNLMPEYLKGVLFFIRYLLKHWSLREKSKTMWHEGENSIFFSSYFFGLSLEKVKHGNFHSHYWNELHGLVHDLRLKENWLHNFEVSPQVPNSKLAKNLLKKINTNPRPSTHSFIESYLSIKIVLKVIINWFKLIVRSFLLNIKSIFKPKNSDINFWPLLKNDWQSSIYGRNAISNLFWIELFDAALKDLPYQEKGLYLCENQAWERAFIFAWYKHGHGKLIAVPHSTIRFWDLRYFSDKRVYTKVCQNFLPQPDFTALNSQFSIQSFLEAGFKREEILECEALRYSFLNNFRNISTNTKVVKRSNTKVLILGDYVLTATEAMLNLLDNDIDLKNKNIKFEIKPHPATTILPEDYPFLDLKVVNEPLKEILVDYDIVYASNMTSAAVDAYCAGMPIIIMLDNYDLNFSPLRGHSNVNFISTSSELFTLIESYKNKKHDSKIQNNFFFLDTDLPRWTSILKSL
ncbi:hypothetical protein N8202_06030 [Gammaproteobacteria bacterium]|jgi:surface carbohydrate biosynthesis protein (TIGR04326 family)|nr:hypothetical protein [Gammaproteobacteria bacterium]